MNGDSFIPEPTMVNAEDLQPFFAGKRLYGDDFSPVEIDRWYEQEREAYAELGAKDRSQYRYGYHALNTFHGWRHLPETALNLVVGFGSAYGDELMPILHRTKQVVILDPSDAFKTTSLGGVPVRYLRPDPSGRLPFPDRSVDLITCFGVLHHVPNVSFVVKEFGRCLVPGGHVLIREPIISMGDWRSPRRGLTRNERGIPPELLRSFLNAASLEIEHRALCMFSLTRHAGALFSGFPFNSRVATRLDAWACRLFIWKVAYHARSVYQKVRPTSAFYVAGKVA